MRPARCLLAALAVAAASSSALAQDYPGNKPVRFIVPMPSGGGTDIVSRVIANKLSEEKWVVVVENKGGAGGNIGADAAAKAPADGYTIVMGQTANLAINPTLYARLPYDPLKDFIPVALVADAPLVFVASAQSKITSLADVVAAAKAKPGTLTLATPGNGTASHLSAELFQSVAGIKLVHIPYKGAAQAATDLMGGQIDLLASSIPSAIAQIRSGALRALAVTSAKRSHLLPDVPTIAESGFPGFDATTWYGVLVPAGTPNAIVTRLNAEINRILQLPDVREKIATEGGDALGCSPEQFGSVLKSDHAKWGAVVRNAGLRLN
jgi:tripartite-type tricarboxylate transporter receptor subunit TctC